MRYLQLNYFIIVFCFFVGCPVIAAKKGSSKRSEAQDYGTMGSYHNNDSSLKGFQAYLIKEKIWMGINYDSGPRNSWRFDSNIILTTEPRDKVGNLVGLTFAGGYGFGYYAPFGLLKLGALGEFFWLAGINLEEYKVALPIFFEVVTYSRFYFQVRNYYIKSDGLDIGEDRAYQKSWMGSNLFAVGYYF